MATPGNINLRISPPEALESAPTGLARKLADEVSARGPMTFRDFMERALYEPGDGYYSRPRTAWDDGADFVTAPQVDAAVGRAVARLAIECDAALGTPPVFDLVDCGGGDGALLADTCDALRAEAPALYERLAARGIERGAAARGRQRERLSAHADRVSWSADVSELEPASIRGLVVSNELLDALAVHRVRRRGERLRELFVDVDDGVLVERELAPSTDALAEYLADNGVALADGQVAEICLQVEPWLESVATAMHEGYVLTIDYGAETATLYGPQRHAGSLVCQHRYQLNDRPLERVGEQDITAHVDFGNLRRCGERFGLEVEGDASLAVLLVGFGAADDVESGEDEAVGGVDAVRRRLGLRHLLFTEIGDAHRALLQRKGGASIRFGLDRLG